MRYCLANLCKGDMLLSYFAAVGEGMLTWCRAYLEAILLKIAKPVEAGIGGSVLPEVGVWRNAQHPLLAAIVVLEGVEKGTLPHCSQIIVLSIHTGLASAVFKAALIFPACDARVYLPFQHLKL